MERARNACYQLLSTDPFHAWLFERTPPSPRNARRAFLDAVSQADVVIWLVGNRTSDAVRQEVEAAIRQSKDVLVFILPAVTRDAMTEHVLATARNAVKTSNVVDPDDLTLQLRQALSDLLIEAYRRHGAPRREVAIQSRLMQLRGIAMAKWLAAGVPVQRSFELFSDSAVGALAESARPTQTNPIRVLVGDVGSGKSLAAIRFLVEAAQSALEDDGAPIPVWLDATAIDHLDEAVEAAANEMGDYRSNGLALVIDGLDERGGEGDVRILAAARSLAYGTPRSSVLVTTRTELDLSLDERERAVPSNLSLEAAVELINSTFGLGLQRWSGSDWSPPIRDAVSRPLFALLMGRHLAQQSGVVGSTGELVEELVSGALGRTQVDAVAVNRTLMELAAKSIDSDGRAILKSDLGDRSIVSEALRTRLVIDDRSSLTFSLPILREWFGAQCLLHGIVTATALANSEQRLERWRYALYVAVSTLPRDAVNATLSAVARRSPAFAAEIVQKNTAHWHGLDSAPGLLPATELGANVRLATEAFVDGIGGLASIVGPSPDGRVPPLRVIFSHGMFSSVWPDPSVHLEGLPGVDEQPPGRLPIGWRSTYSGQARPEAIWPWRHALNEMRARLSGRLKATPFYVQGGAMEREVAWASAVELTRKDVLFQPIPADPLRDWIREHGNFQMIKIGQRFFPLDALRSELQRGDSVVVCPYPDRDRELGGLIWSGFSPDRVLARTIAVYSAALEIYESWINAFFACMRPRLHLAQLLPARLTGTLEIGEDSQGPGLSYCLEPLPSHQRTAVSIALGPIDRDARDKLREIAELVRAVRPESAAWIHPFITETALHDLFTHTPALAVAWRWLNDDLSSVGWLENPIDLGWF
jgi:hypothetical protein